MTKPYRTPPAPQQGGQSASDTLTLMLELARANGLVILDHEEPTEYGEAWFVFRRPDDQTDLMVQEDRATQTIRFSALDDRPSRYSLTAALALLRVVSSPPPPVTPAPDGAFFRWRAPWLYSSAPGQPFGTMSSR